MLVKEVKFCLKRFFTCSKTVACMVSVQKTSEGRRGKIGVVKNAKSEILHCLLLVEKFGLPIYAVNKLRSFTCINLRTSGWWGEFTSILGKAKTSSLYIGFRLVFNVPWYT